MRTVSVAGLAGGLTLLLMQAAPAGAQEERGSIVPYAASVSPSAPAMPGLGDAWVVSGDFAGDEREELFMYRSGSEPDHMVSFDNAGTGGSQLTWQVFDHSVSGRYQPVVGDFDGNGHDDILWYGFGSDPDYLWEFSDFDTVTSGPTKVNGIYTPVVGRFTQDDADDIIWYGYGTDRDVLWDFSSTELRRQELTINGQYQPVAGSFASDSLDDVLWYGFGTAPDFMWDFTPSTTVQHTTTETAVNGHYTPFTLDAWNDGARGSDIWWVGEGPDNIWDFQNGVLRRTSDGYDPDHPAYLTTGDLLGDGYEDFTWVRSDGRLILWDHGPDANSPIQLARWTYAIQTTP